MEKKKMSHMADKTANAHRRHKTWDPGGHGDSRKKSLPKSESEKRMTRRRKPGSLCKENLPPHYFHSKGKSASCAGRRKKASKTRTSRRCSGQYNSTRKEGRIASISHLVLNKKKKGISALTANAEGKSSNHKERQETAKPSHRARAEGMTGRTRE